MDASTLMASDYLQPLVHSDLRALVTQILDPENMAWLRHTSAKKFLQWRNRLKIHNTPSNFYDTGRTPLATTLQDPFSTTFPTSTAASTSSLLSSPSPSQVLLPHATSPFYSLSPSAPGTSSPTSPLHPEFALTRLSQPPQIDPRYTNIHLAKWATDLQRSLRNERERYAQLEHSQRAQWLLERVGEEVAGGRILAAPGTLPPSGTSTYSPPVPEDAEWAVVRHGRVVGKGKGTGGTNWAGVSLDPRDPLGLCELGDGLWRGGVVVLGVAGVGAVWFAVGRVVVEMGWGEGWWGWVGGERR